MSSKEHIASKHIKQQVNYQQSVLRSYNASKRQSRYVYNSKCNPKQIESEMVHPLQYSFMLGRAVLNDVSKRSYASVVKAKTQKCIPCMAVNSEQNRETHITKDEHKESVSLEEHKKCSQQSCGSGGVEVRGQSVVPEGALGRVNTHSGPAESKHLQFDIDSCVNDKFAHALLYRLSGRDVHPKSNCSIFQQFKTQSKYNFGFVPLSEQILPSSRHESSQSFD